LTKIHTSPSDLIRSTDEGEEDDGGDDEISKITKHLMVFEQKMSLARVQRKTTMINEFHTKLFCHSSQRACE
jgi:hypothetical protein